MKSLAFVSLPKISTARRVSYGISVDDGSNFSSSTANISSSSSVWIDFWNGFRFYAELWTTGFELTNVLPPCFENPPLWIDAWDEPPCGFFPNTVLAAVLFVCDSVPLNPCRALSHRLNCCYANMLAPSCSLTGRFVRFCLNFVSSLSLNIHTDWLC